MQLASPEFRSDCARWILSFTEPLVDPTSVCSRIQGMAREWSWNSSPPQRRKILRIFCWVDFLFRLNKSLLKCLDGNLEETRVNYAVKITTLADILGFWVRNSDFEVPNWSWEIHESLGFVKSFISYLLPSQIILWKNLPNFFLVFIPRSSAEPTILFYQSTIKDDALLSPEQVFLKIVW